MCSDIFLFTLTFLSKGLKQTGYLELGHIRSTVLPVVMSKSNTQWIYLEMTNMATLD